jgi:5-methylcytosine-specific restriction protein B
LSGFIPDQPATRKKPLGEVQPPDSLEDLIEAWRTEHGYPSEGDLAARETLARLSPSLSEVALEDPDWTAIRAVIADRTRGRLGQAGSAPLNFIDQASPEEQEHFLREIRSLLFGSEPLAARLDAFRASGLKGIKGAVAFKLLSFSQPDRILPIFSYWSNAGKGKEALLQLPVLGLTPPSAGSFGDLSVAGNDAIRERLAPHFDDDTWGMSRFLYWLRTHHPPGHEAPPSSLQALAGELYVDKAFLEKTVTLLERKLQIILYGPPGTGKTFIARKLAHYLTEGDPARFEIVQFHPSYSYEDFVQGYRPQTSAEGSVTYELKDGPLLRLANAARSDPEVPYVLLIDEINRGNLPRILGELLYLLEYRKDSVTLMYGQAGERFDLPANLLFIGTMNTADRSIGLIDAAMRRRFSFVPLFPGSYPLTDTLRNWLHVEAPEMAFVAEVVDRLNARLIDRFGEQLQVGYSYFMQDDLDDDLLEAIWRADILPFLEDQLLGREEDGTREFQLTALRRSESSGQTALETGDVDDSANSSTH